MKKNSEVLVIDESSKIFELRVISEDGIDLGVMTKKKALELAREASLDLVILNNKLEVPIVKIIDLGKSLYLKNKKKTQKIVKIKEIKIRPKIGVGDFITKAKQICGFLKDGNRVKVTVVFKRGRESLNKEEQGRILYEQIEAFLKENKIENFDCIQDSNMGILWSRIYFLKK